MAKGFLLLASYRSGSTWVIDVLNHVQGFSAYSELFAAPEKTAGTENLTIAQARETTEYLDQTIRAYPHYYQPGTKSGVRPFSVFSYLDRFYQRDGINGFKLMYTQLAKHPETWMFMMRRKIAIIHLIRRNHLDVIISREMRKATKTTHRIVGAQETKAAQVTLEPDDLIKQMRLLQRNINMARNLITITRVRSLEIFYEELVKHPSSFSILFDFLHAGDVDHQARSSLVKLVQGGYEESIANYSEVRKVVLESEFASLLDG